MLRITWKVIFWFALIALFHAGIAIASHQDDEIEAALSKEVGEQVASKLGEDLSEEDRAYAYFLLAVYEHDPAARKKAEAIYERLNTLVSQAFLGSLSMLQARDWEGGFFQGLFKRKRLVQRGIKDLDALLLCGPVLFEEWRREESQGDVFQGQRLDLSQPIRGRIEKTNRGASVDLA